jgi:hypothetical protein
MTKSKRFLVLLLSVAIFVMGITIFKIDAINLATALTILTSPYLVVQSVRPSGAEKII